MKLQTCLLESPNHKVRIAAAQAMTVLKEREPYGRSFPHVFQTYVKALREVEHGRGVSFANRKYQDTLRAQVSVALLRAMQLCRRGDFGDMKAFLIEQAQFIYEWLLRMEELALDHEGAGRAPGSPARQGAASKAPVGTKHVRAAFENMTLLYESRMQTIPLSLLTKYQDKAFGPMG